jgi:DNA-binding NarL/FixJ family response regulator
MPNTENPMLNRLSARERQVLQLTAAGLSVAKIAAAMRLSAGTIEIYRNRVMVKLDIYEVAALVRFAHRFGVIAPSSAAL